MLSSTVLASSGELPYREGWNSHAGWRGAVPRLQHGSLEGQSVLQSCSRAFKTLSYSIANRSNAGTKSSQPVFCGSDARDRRLATLAVETGSCNSSQRRNGDWRTTQREKRGRCRRTAQTAVATDDRHERRSVLWHGPQPRSRHEPCSTAPFAPARGHAVHGHSPTTPCGTNVREHVCAEASSPGDHGQ